MTVNLSGFVWREGMRAIRFSEETIRKAVKKDLCNLKIGDLILCKNRTRKWIVMESRGEEEIFVKMVDLETGEIGYKNIAWPIFRGSLVFKAK